MGRNKVYIVIVYKKIYKITWVIRVVTVGYYHLPNWVYCLPSLRHVTDNCSEGDNIPYRKAQAGCFAHHDEPRTVSHDVYA